MIGPKTGSGRLFSRASTVLQKLLALSSVGAPAVLMLSNPAAAQEAPPLAPQTTSGATTAAPAAGSPVLLVSQCPRDLRRIGTRLFPNEAEARDAAETLDPDCRSEIVRYNGVGLESDVQYVQMSGPVRVTGATDPDESPDKGLGNVDMTMMTDSGYVAGVPREQSLSTSLNLDISVDVLGPLYMGAEAGVVNGKMTYGAFAGANIARGLSAQIGYGKEAPASTMSDLNTLTGAQRTYNAVSGEVNYTARDIGVRVGGVYGPELREANAYVGARLGDFRLEAQGVMGQAQNLGKQSGYDSDYYGVRGGVYYNVGRFANLDGLMVGPEARFARSTITTPRAGLLPEMESSGFGVGVNYTDRDTGSRYGVSFMPSVSRSTTIGSNETRARGWGVFVNLFSPIAFGGRRASAVAFDNVNYRVETAQRQEANRQIAMRERPACVIVEDPDNPQNTRTCPSTRTASGSATPQPLAAVSAPAPVTTTPTPAVVNSGGNVDQAFNALCGTANGWRYAQTLYASNRQTGTLTPEFQSLYARCEARATSLGLTSAPAPTEPPTRLSGLQPAIIGGMRP